MSNQKILPNVVGRLDDVVDALKAGDQAKADDLLRQESRRRREYVEFLERSLDLEKSKLLDLVGVHVIVQNAHLPGLSEKWASLRRECGWDGAQ